jgi:hypothetical protein
MRFSCLRSILDVACSANMKLWVREAERIQEAMPSFMLFTAVTACSNKKPHRLVKTTDIKLAKGKLLVKCNAKYVESPRI